MSVGKHVFSKTGHRIFLKLLMKSECLKGKKTDGARFFGENLNFGDNVPKHPKNSFFGFCKKKAIEL